LSGLVLAGGASVSQAQEAAPLTLFCTGTDATVTPVIPYTWSGRAYAGGMSYAESRTAAQLGIAVDGGKVRVKPAKGSVPVFSKESKDGWYDLTEVAVDRFSIRGRLKWNRLERVKLEVDRRTGAVTFGDFQGTCQPVAPDATKF
jgi:hypothetical protein